MSLYYLVAECELHKRGTGRVGGEMWEVNEGSMELFDTKDSSKRAEAVLGDKWWSQTTNQEGNKVCKRFLCDVLEKRNEHPNVGCVCIGSRNGAPSRTG